ncbi:MAG TPA: hypothetical protein VNO70_22705 [Blastocatellia bacterium]|nr:hypothetical protein [Blastocatellia bacterium]
MRALAHQPKIVLADEPTGNLNSRSGHAVFELMREMNRLRIAGIRRAAGMGLKTGLEMVKSPVRGEMFIVRSALV